MGKGNETFLRFRTKTHFEQECAPQHGAAWTAPAAASAATSAARLPRPAAASRRCASGVQACVYTCIYLGIYTLLQCKSSYACSRAEGEAE